MFNFDTVREYDMITIPDNGVDEKGIVYQVHKKEIGAFGGIVNFLQLRKVSKTGGFEKAELVYDTAGQASIIYGEKRECFTKVEGCAWLYGVGGVEVYQIRIGRFTNK